MKRLVLGMVLMLVAPGAFAAKELAKVNGKPINDTDLTQALSNVSEGQRASYLKDLNARRQILQKVIDQEVLVQEAEKAKLDSDQEYKDAVAAFRRSFLANRFLEKNLRAKLSAAEAKKFYEKNKHKYSTEQVHAMHILVSDEKEAREILEKAKAPGADFQALAEKHSKDPSAKHNRGDMGFFGRDRMVPEFTEAAFSTKAGEIVGPVKTNFGYHVIKVVERKSGKTLGYDEVEMKVNNDLQQETIRVFLQNLRKEAKIAIDEKAVEKM